MTNILLCDTRETDKLLPAAFVQHDNNPSLLQSSYLRNTKLCNESVIVSTPCHYFTAYDLVEELKQGEPYFLLEPLNQNPAAAIVMASLSLDPETIVLVSHAELQIADEELYQKSIQEAKELAESEMIIRLDCKPDNIEINYSPMEENSEYFDNTQRTAQKSDIFCFKVDLFLETLQNALPEFYMPLRKAYDNAKHEEMTRIIMEDIQMVPQMNMDELLYSIAEKNRGRVLQRK